MAITVSNLAIELDKFTNDELKTLLKNNIEKKNFKFSYQLAENTVLTDDEVKYFIQYTTYKIRNTIKPKVLRDGVEFMIRLSQLLPSDDLTLIVNLASVGFVEQAQKLAEDKNVNPRILLLYGAIESHSKELLNNILNTFNYENIDYALGIERAFSSGNVDAIFILYDISGMTLQDFRKIYALDTYLYPALQKIIRERISGSRPI